MNEREFIDTLKKSLNASKKAYKKMSIQGMAHVRENYSFEGFQKSWIETIDEVVEKHGSWDTRKNYKTWQLLEVA
jgi:hypothetical protein